MISIFHKIKMDFESHVKELHRDRHPYLVTQMTMSGATWKIMKGANGCRPVQTQEAILMEKTPAPLPGKNILSIATDAVFPDINSFDKSQIKSKSSMAIDSKNSTQKIENSKKEEKCSRLPPFDMMDLPQAMNAMGFKYSSYCADRWFKGKAHVIKEKSETAEDSDYVDTGSLKLDWILKFGNVREKYNHLKSADLEPTESENVYNKIAASILAKKFRRFMGQHQNYYSGRLDCWERCGSDIQKLHEQFQFQLSFVSMFDALGGAWRVVGNELKDAPVMNDLAASLANFYFFAAVAEADISTNKTMYYGSHPWQTRSRTTIKITHIYMYAKDVYSFNDDAESSQYLGHWNRRGVIVIHAAVAAEATSKFLSQISKKLIFEAGNESKTHLPTLPEYLDKPVDVGSNLKEKEVFYPVRNRNFENWRKVKKRGGDFKIFSNLEKVKLPRPIVIDLGEICEEYVQ